MQRGQAPAAAVAAGRPPGREAWLCKEAARLRATHQVRSVDDVRVPVAGHVVVRQNYAACKRLKCVGCPN